MGLLDVLRGQRKPKRANIDRLFAISTSYPTLTVNLELESTHAAGVCFKPVEAAAFSELQRDMEELLAIASRDTGTTARRVDDEMGFTWIVLEDPDFEDLVTTTHLVNGSIEERGFSEQLLCSVFGFRTSEGQAVDFVYAYKRGTFYPFVPDGERSRDNATEIRLNGALSREMPMEPELERWYPVWNAPVGGSR
ncbi:MAG: PspA-associated protein PspAB [Miltoncostaeaceae bacterium]